MGTKFRIIPGKDGAPETYLILKPGPLTKDFEKGTNEVKQYFKYQRTDLTSFDRADYTVSEPAYQPTWGYLVVPFKYVLHSASGLQAVATLGGAFGVQHNLFGGELLPFIGGGLAVNQTNSRGASGTQPGLSIGAGLTFQSTASNSPQFGFVFGYDTGTSASSVANRWWISFSFTGNLFSPNNPTSKTN